ncbi:MAG TPA: zinc ribbon domain-containing protein [Candidatus Solibacter sp.]|nr:zinc ribbon domain-containing protein [Candidatus Solibacter sp.]
MFCSACGTANTDTAKACRVCGEPLAREDHWKKWVTAVRKWADKRAKLLLLVLWVLFASAVPAIHFYGASQEFEITGELLYKLEEADTPDVRPVAGARIEVFEDKGKGFLNSRYSLLLVRRSELEMGPGVYDSKVDIMLSPLKLAPLSRMNWGWWEGERLRNCGWASQLFKESQQTPAVYATTNTNVSGHFWLKLKRGKYFITAESQVPSFWRLEDDPIHRPDTSAPVTGSAFWCIPVTVTGNTKVVSAEPECSP